MTQLKAVGKATPKPTKAEVLTALEILLKWAVTHGTIGNPCAYPPSRMACASLPGSKAQTTTLTWNYATWRFRQSVGILLDFRRIGAMLE